MFLYTNFDWLSVLLLDGFVGMQKLTTVIFLITFKTQHLSGERLHSR